MLNRLRCVESESRAKLRYIQWGGFAQEIFGMPFLAGGLFFLWLFVFRGIPKLFQTPFALSDVPVILIGFCAIFGCGAMFTVAGAFAIFDRTGAILDTKSGVATTWSGILWWRRSTDCDVREFTHVAVERQTWAGVLGSAQHCYAVVLKGPAKNVEIVTNRVRNRIEKTADDVAAFLGLIRTGESVKATPAGT